MKKLGQTLMGGVLLTKGSWSSGEGEILDSEEGSRPDYGDFSPRALLVTMNRTTSPLNWLPMASQAVDTENGQEKASRDQQGYPRG